MNWKTEIRVADLDPKSELEITCKRCGLHRYEAASDLAAQSRLSQLFLDELEKALVCRVKTCRGPVKISIVHDDLNEGFVGGMA